MKHRTLTRRDVEYAVAQRHRGITWREIGAQLAILNGRAVAFHGPSVMRAVLPFMETQPLGSPSFSDPPFACPPDREGA